MLSAQGFWAGRDLYRATPTATRDLGLYGLIRKTGTHVPQWDSKPPMTIAPDSLNHCAHQMNWLYLQIIKNMLKYWSYVNLALHICQHRNVKLIAIYVEFYKIEMKCLKWKTVLLFIYLPCSGYHPKCNNEVIHCTCLYFCVRNLIVDFI